MDKQHCVTCNAHVDYTVVDECETAHYKNRYFNHCRRKAVCNECGTEIHINAIEIHNEQQLLIEYEKRLERDLLL